MDPSIMKFLVEEKDATMHPGADVEAFTAALNRVIKRDTTLTSQTPVTTTDASGGISRLRQPLQQMHIIGIQQAMAATGQAPNAMNRPSGKQVPFAQLLPIIEPQLDKDRAMQLQGLYLRLTNNNINKTEFVMHLRSLVGDHMLKMAVYKLQQRQIPPYVLPSSIHQSPDASSPSMDNNPKIQDYWNTN